MSGVKSFFWTRAGAPAGVPRLGAAGGVTVPDPADYNDLLFHGGVIEHVPSVYLIFWGTEWQKGFRTDDGSSGATLAGPAPTPGTHSYTGAQARSYITKF